MRERSNVASAELGPVQHFVRMYPNSEFPVDETVQFLSRALQQGGTAIVIARSERLEEIQSLLVPGDGDVIALDAREALAMFMVDGRPDGELFQSTIGERVARACASGPVHAFGEMVALLCDDGMPEAALELELLWSRLARRLDFGLMCAYSWRSFSEADHSGVFQHICAAHGRVDLSPRDVDVTPALDSMASTHTVAALRQRALALDNEARRRREAEDALQLRERELADFVDNAAEGLHKVSGDGVILWANRAELSMLGYEWEEYVGRSIVDFHVDQHVIHDILRRLKAGETLYDQPARLRCKDGSIKPVLIHSNGYFEDGKLMHTRCFTRDATSRQEKERLLEELAHASRAKDEFLAMLGHELRNPLSPIVTALQLMRMRGDTGTSREQAIIERQVEHLVRLVDDLLDVSRITRGKIELRRRKVQLSEALTKAVEMASLLLEQRHHHLHLDLEPGLEWEGDPARLAQVVSNLLTNAARYTSPGGDIRLRAWRSAANQVAIGVRDNGIGISPEASAHIFDLFYQSKQGLDRSEGGLGIGLALVKNLVELHGGTVDVQSDGPGQGSEFVVRLPAPSASDKLIVAERPAQPVTATPTTTCAVPKRVVVVDDNADNAEVLGTLFAMEGFDVEVFFDPAAALASISKRLPDVAVLDIGLPVMDGYELAQRIRAIDGSQHCRLVALSGYGQQDDLHKSKAHGFNHHLVKPAEPSAVLSVVHGLLSH